MCQSCKKGLCAECALDNADGLACRGRCEDEVRKQGILRDEQIKTVTDQQEQSLRWARRISRTSVISSFTFGAVFLAWGYAQSFWFPLVIGSCIILFASVEMLLLRKRP